MLRQESEDLAEPSEATMEQMMITKATELFTLCDTEQKGFITKRDMQRLRDELPISPDQLEIVFDSLDDDRNGYLTLEEFTEGFGSFLGMKPRTPGGGNGSNGGDSLDDQGVVFEGEAGESEDTEKVYGEMMMHIDARGVFQDENVVKAMWMKLHKDEPDLLGTFEDFLNRTASDLKKSRGEFQTLESVLKSKANEHEEEVKKLYEEMEFQMKREQERILAEEKAKEKQLREEMEFALQDKEKLLSEMHHRHQELEDKLKVLNLAETTTKQDNLRLQQEKEQLEEMLTESQDNLEESRSYISMLQTQQMNDKRERARAALQLSEGIAMERETLVKQLDMLKDVNKKLLDDKDEAEAIEARRALAQQTPQEPPKQQQRKGSILAKYFPGGPTVARQRSETLPEELEEMDFDDDEDIEMDDLAGAQIYTFHGKHHHIGASNELITDSDQVHLNASLAEENIHSDVKNANTSKDTTEESENVRGYSSGSRRGSNVKSAHSPNAGWLTRGDSYTSDAESEEVVKKGQSGLQTKSVGMFNDAIDGAEAESQMTKLKRIFKVVFVGDSGVGKSSFIHRFCNDTFRATFSATIGVDFQVKPLVVGDSIVVLQLWDTAGQERYRSVTKQYFRKADGVIVMYDVTSEQSFLNVRQWMDSVEQGVEEGTVISIIGNKTDLCEADPETVTKVKDGSKLAVAYNALFYETSAKSGSYVNEAMLGMASLLQDKEDKAIEAALTLTDEPKKKGCCKK